MGIANGEHILIKSQLPSKVGNGQRPRIRAARRIADIASIALLAVIELLEVCSEEELRP